MPEVGAPALGRPGEENASEGNRKRGKKLAQPVLSLEQLPELLTDPRALRDGYLEQVNGFISELRRGCRDQNMDYVQLRTDQDLSVALSSYLGHRLAR